MLKTVYDAVDKGGCLITENGATCVDLRVDTTLRGFSEKLFKLDDIRGRQRCLCHVGTDKKPSMSAADVLMAPFCDLLMIVGAEECVLYPKRVLDRIGGALAVEV